jgi:hypothetical protein
MNSIVEWLHDAEQRPKELVCSVAHRMHAGRLTTVAMGSCHPCDVVTMLVKDGTNDLARFL